MYGPTAVCVCICVPSTRTRKGTNLNFGRRLTIFSSCTFSVFYLPYSSFSFRLSFLLYTFLFLTLIFYYYCKIHTQRWYVFGFATAKEVEYEGEARERTVILTSFFVTAFRVRRERE